MALRKYKPTSPGRRFRSVSTFEEVTKTEPEKSLLEPLKNTGGRNMYGRITTRHQGGGHKRRYRVVDFQRRQGAGRPAGGGAPATPRTSGAARQGAVVCWGSGRGGGARRSTPSAIRTVVVR